VKLRVEVFHVAVQLDAAIGRIDLRLVCGEQALARADRDVPAQHGIAGAAEVAGVAGDVDALVVRVRLQQLVDPRVGGGVEPAGGFGACRRGVRISGQYARAHARAQCCPEGRPAQHGNERNAPRRGRFYDDGPRRRHPGDYNCARSAASD
jgi:hypothetical protein